MRCDACLAGPAGARDEDQRRLALCAVKHKPRHGVARLIDAAALPPNAKIFQPVVAQQFERREVPLIDRPQHATYFASGQIGNATFKNKQAVWRQQLVNAIELSLWIVGIVQRRQEKDQVERAVRSLCDIADREVDIEAYGRGADARQLDWLAVGIDAQNIRCAAALGLEAKEPFIASQVQHALALQNAGKFEVRQFFQRFGPARTIFKTLVWHA